MVVCNIFQGDKDASSAIKNYDEPISNKQIEVRSHEGYLYKQANSIYKGWRLSYFVIEDRKTVSNCSNFRLPIIMKFSLFNTTTLDLVANEKNQNQST